MKVVQAIGAPGMLYGIDVVGASNTHLLQVRVAALQAILPPGASRNVDTSFAVLDADCGMLGPAFQAHALPIKHWGMALWQQWVPFEDLKQVFETTLNKLTEIRDSGRSVWNTVAGPVAAVVASAWRIGWTCTSAR